MTTQNMIISKEYIYHLEKTTQLCKMSTPDFFAFQK